VKWSIKPKEAMHVSLMDKAIPECIVTRSIKLYNLYHLYMNKNS